MSRHLLRLLAANLLPAPILTWVKTQYYVRSVENFGKDVEPVKAIVKSGDYVVDMGANFGWYTNALSSMVDQAGRCTVLSLYPIRFGYSAVLCKNSGSRTSIF